MAWFTWFKKKEPENYEGVLAALDLDIQKRRSCLSEIRLRERRTSLLLTLYACGIWVAYVATWYTGILQKQIKSSRFGEAITAVSVFLGPIVIQFARRIMQWWFARIESAEEKTLKGLLSQQRAKLEEIRKKTNFNSIKSMLDRYEYPAAASQRPFAANGMPDQQQNQMVQRRTMPPHKPAQANGTAAAATVPATIASSVTGQLMPMMPPRKHWYDKFADLLLGDDDSGANGPASRYALICQRCATHNGLVPPSLYEVTQYVCPKCGHFNPPPRAASGSAGTLASASSVDASNTSADLFSSSSTSFAARSLAPTALAADPHARHLQDAFAAAMAGKVTGSRKPMPTTNTPGKSDADAVLLQFDGDAELESDRRRSPQAKLAEWTVRFDSGGSTSGDGSGDGSAASASLSVDANVEDSTRSRKEVSEVEDLVEAVKDKGDDTSSLTERR